MALAKAKNGVFVAGGSALSRSAARANRPRWEREVDQKGPTVYNQAFVDSNGCRVLNRAVVVATWYGTHGAKDLTERMRAFGQSVRMWRGMRRDRA